MTSSWNEAYFVKESNIFLGKLSLNFNDGIAKLNFLSKIEVSKPPDWVLNHGIALKVDKHRSSSAAKTLTGIKLESDRTT